MNPKTFEKAAGGLTGVCISALGTSTDEIYNWVGIICSVLGLAITIAPTVVIPFIQKTRELAAAYKEAVIHPGIAKEAAPEPSDVPQEAKAPDFGEFLAKAIAKGEQQ